MDIRDRVKQFVRVPASKVKPSPLNWRTHPKEQADALRGVLSSIGFAGAVLARELPDGSLEAIDGHLRLETMGAAEVPVLVTDLTESEAKTLLVTYDPLGAMAGTNAAKLDELLRDVQTGNEAVAGMLAKLAESAGVIPEPERLSAMPDLMSTESHVVTIRYTSADEAALKAFVGCPPDELLDPTRTGRAVLERIKDAAAG